MQQHTMSSLAKAMPLLSLKIASNMNEMKSGQIGVKSRQTQLKSQHMQQLAIQTNLESGHIYDTG